MKKYLYKNFSDNIKFVPINTVELKKFQKVFTEEEKLKYLDPYGFMNQSECIY